MINLAHITQGDALTNTTLSRTFPGAFTSAFSSRWSVTTVPTWRRTQVDRFASSSAIRMYTSYSGMRSTGGAAAPSARTLAGCVFAATPSLLVLMQLLVRIEGDVLAARALLREPRVEARGNQAVGALLLIRGAHCHDVRVFVLDVLVVAAHPAPIDRVRRRHLLELLPQLCILERTRLPPPTPPLPVLGPLVHSLHEILGVGDILHDGVPPLAANPFERRDGAGERHFVVGRLRRAFIEIPSRHAVARWRFDQRRVAPATRLAAVVAETAFVGVYEHERSGHG